MTGAAGCPRKLEKQASIDDKQASQKYYLHFELPVGNSQLCIGCLQLRNLLTSNFHSLHGRLHWQAGISLPSHDPHDLAKLICRMMSAASAVQQLQAGA